MTRITRDEEGREVYQVPTGTPKEEIAKAKAEGRVDKNDPNYTAEDAAKDAERDEEAREELVGSANAEGTETGRTDRDDSSDTANVVADDEDKDENQVERTENVRPNSDR